MAIKPILFLISLWKSILPNECTSNASSVRVYVYMWITCLSLFSSSGIPASLSVALLKSLYWRTSCTSSGSPVLTASCRTAHTDQHSHHCLPMRFTEDAYLGRQGKVLKRQWKLDTNDLFLWFQTCVIFSFFSEEYTQRYSPDSDGNSFQYNDRERGLGLKCLDVSDAIELLLS